MLRVESSKLRLALAALCLTAGVFVPASWARQADADEGVHRKRPEVVVQLRAVDKQGQPFEGLKPEDLRVTIEGQPQSLLYFMRATEEPLHVVFMLDASASQERLLPLIQLAAVDLASTLLREGRNDAAVVSFTGDAKVVQGLTADTTTIRRAIASVEFIPPPGYAGGGIMVGPPKPNTPVSRAGSTAIWEALVTACEEVFAHAKPGRRAVVLVSDGVDTSSRIKLQQAVERLTREGVVIYGVGIADKYAFDPVDKSALGKITERTGGRALFPKKPKDLPSTFEQIRRELLTSYTFKFNPPPAPPGTPLKLRVELVNPELRRQGLQLTYPPTLFPE